MAWTNPTHQRAAELAGDYLPEYMAAWIAGVLRETHTLPALIHHQDQLARDVLSIAVVQHEVPDDMCRVDECPAAPRCSSGATVWHKRTPDCAPAETLSQQRGELR